MKQPLPDFILNLQLFADEGTTSTEDTTTNVGNEFAQASWEEKAQMLRDFNNQSEQPAEEKEEQEEPAETEEVEQSETDSTETEQQADEPKFKVKVNGVEEEVSLEELRNGYQRNKDYTQGKQAVSQERKELDEMKAKLEMLTAQTAPKFNPITAAEQKANYYAEQFRLMTVSAENPSGIEYDKFDFTGVHDAIMEEVKTKVSFEQQIQQATNHVRQQIQADPSLLQDFDTAMYGLLATETGRSEFNKVYEAKSRVLHGNPTVDDLQLVDQFYIKAKSVKQVTTKPKVMPQTKQTPPKVERAGVSVSEDNKPAFNKKAFASGSLDDQKSMIRKMRESGQI